MSEQYSTFQVGDLFFGVEVVKVQEVLRYQEMTRVPLAPGVVQGLINLRGQIVTALDMRSRLGLAQRPAEMTPMNLVLRSDEGAVSLLVDEIGDVLEVETDCYERVPETIPPEQRELIAGVCKLEGRLLLVLDTEKAMQLQ
jgi:purine-binding chemotaxis protein CheW